MSKNYQKVKTLFDTGVWGMSRVRDAVIKKWITPEEFEMITGIAYGV